MDLAPSPNQPNLVKEGEHVPHPPTGEGSR